ncbi:transcription initiation factor TFIID component TAF4 family-domain-containing protein [Sparassis latifolia]|uniref:Transcription initiation factor TFIID subunit 4 n=1 Tax=Sparassis crispa TaxID=139825 RepID=A0A401GDF7_9APHY|nr:Transcription initiation factor TFIID subunit 4 [Sparassis crispa]GBE80216.1 Transcription initiation factor TFIID subunit 4 [Sparassis crispa]
MKTEQDPSTPMTTFSAAQWGPTQIPIDPALQQQSQQATSTYPHYQTYQHYPQASYSHYQQYAPPQTAQQIQSQAVAPTSRQAAQSNAMDTADIATLNDALGSAGVDLRAEEETLHRTYDQFQQSYRPYEDRTRTQPAAPNFNTQYLGTTMRAVGTQHKVTKVPEDSVNYMALALRARLQDLIVAMVAASEHRTDTQFDRPASHYADGSPMWSIVIRSDVGKQLAAIEKVERDEEVRVRRERKERAEAAAAQHAALAAQAGAGMGVDGGFDDEGAPKKKKKKEGPGVTARNMSEDVRKKMSNAVASQAAGLGTGKYAWMTAANANASVPAKPKPTATASAGSSGGANTPASAAAPAAGSTATAGGWARPYVPTRPSQQQMPQREDLRRAITLRDAMFVIEKERGHGGGRGSATGWT